MQESVLSRLERLDAQRPRLPGEHWITLGAGLLLLMRPQRTLLGRLCALAAGATLVYRAANGRDGLVPWLRGELRHGAHARQHDEDYVDVAAPWPHDERVRVSTEAREPSA